MENKEMIIHCKYDELVDINLLIPNPRNNNDHAEEDIEDTIKILSYQGIVQPCTVSKLSGYMVDWHLRLTAAKRMGLKEIPVIYRDYEDEAQEYCDLTARNELGKRARLNRSKVNADIADLGPFDISMLGIKDFLIEPAEIPQKKKKIKLCPHCGEEV